MNTKITKEKIIKLIDSIDSVFEKEINFSGVYSRPTKSLNEDYINYDLHIIRSHLPFSSEKLVDYFSYIHRWFPANPSKERIVDKANELYVDRISGKHKYSGFPSRKIVNSILQDSSEPKDRKYNIEQIIKQNKYIVVLGNKGVGKTTFFNYWLNNRTSYFEQIEKKLWFRVDASKLYGLNSIINPLENCEPFNLETYHKVHVIYVVTKYGTQINNSSPLSMAWKNIQYLSQEDQELFDFIGMLQKSVIDSELVPDDKDTERFLNWAIKNDSILLIKRLYDKCHQYWLEENYKIIFIVDGIDNISWTRENTTHYQHLCSEVGRLFINDYRNSFCDHFSNIIIVIRPETYKHIESTFQEDHLNDNNKNRPFKCVVAPACTDEIIKHKSNITLSPRSLDLSEFKNNIALKIQEDQSSFNEILFERELHIFNNLSKGYLVDLARTIKRKYIQLEKFYAGKDYDSTFEAIDFNEFSDLIQILFNDNIRACVDNFIENYTTIEFAKKKQIPGATNISRYPQYLLLNGRLFLDSPNVNIRVRGESYPNIFWWNMSWVDVDSTGWFGLSVIRIFQLMKECNEIKVSFLSEVLNTLFDYPNNLVSMQIDRLVKYGLIKYADNRTLGNDYYVTATKKGGFIFEYTFMNPDWIYFFALDTPLDHELSQDKDSRYIKLHRDSENNFINVFNVAYISTTITFCRHIWTQQTIDQGKIEQHWDEYKLKQNTNGLFFNYEHALSIFMLPTHFNFFVKKDLNLMFLGLYRRDKTIAYEFYKDLIGLYADELKC